MKTFILADNQDITRLGFISIVQGCTCAEAIVEVSGLAQLQLSLKQYPKALVVLDYTLFDFESLAQMLIVKAAFAESNWLLFSEELSAAFLRQALTSDPSIHVIMKLASKSELKTALHQVLAGENYVCEEVKELLKLDSLVNEIKVSLTKGEISVLQQIAMGKTTKEIAISKNLSFHTVNSHRKNIFRKLQVNSLQEAIRYAIRAGLSDLSDYSI